MTGAMAVVARQRNNAQLGGTASNVNDSDTGPAASGAVGPSPTPNLLPTGGSGSYSYSWAQTGGTAESGPHTISSATAQNPTWSNPDVGASDSPTNENWTCTITDTVYNIDTFDVTISVNLVWIQDV